jgi:hypothetical protein
MTQREQIQLQRMMDEILEMKQDLSELKTRILSPDDGLIVQTNKNTWWREQIDKQIRLYDEKVVEFESLKKWQSAVNRALWIAFSAIIAIAVKLIFES